MSKKLVVSLSPHIHNGDTIQSNMKGVLIALIPALAVSLLYFGLADLYIILTSVLSCIVLEFVINKYLFKSDRLTITDGSAALTGLLLALNLPSGLPLWMVILGAVFAIGVIKMSFGGLGNNLFNPALMGRVFLLISFPAQMTTWPVNEWASNAIDGASGATPLGIMTGVLNHAPGVSLNQLPSAWEMFIGTTGGSIGEMSALALLLGLVYMIWKKVITWHIPITIIATAFIFAEILHLVDPSLYADGLSQILSGGLMLGAIFMATDYVTSPMSFKGQMVYGVAIGLLTIIIRVWGAYPEGMSFAIIIMNGFTPLINTYIRPTLFSSLSKKVG